MQCPRHELFLILADSVPKEAAVQFSSLILSTTGRNFCADEKPITIYVVNKLM